MNRHLGFHAWLFRWARAGAMLLAMAAAQAGPIPGQGTWETTLHARDINGDSIVDAYYDSVQDITWLADANAGAGSIFDNGFSSVDGAMTWSNANSWAQGLDLYGVTGWRLPQFVGGGQSEVSLLYFNTLSNADDPPNPMDPPGWVNTALFSNLTGWYWLSDPAGAGQHYLWVTDSISAYHHQESDSATYRAWAVHSGDVVAIPEPQTAALMGLGLAVLWLAFRRRSLR